VKIALITLLLLIYSDSKGKAVAMGPLYLQTVFF